MPSIAVSVVNWPRHDTLFVCLAHLRSAGADAAVVDVRADGVAQARNRALASCRADVLAFVEDDVLVEASWLCSLTEAWAAADSDVAVVGGPLHLTGAPPWSGLPTLELGDRPLEVDLTRRTFHGANVSFRCSALRGVAGFWPARGGARDWFGAEHHAQHALGAGGWRGRYEPGAGAERRASAQETRAWELLRRRARYGARLAAGGGQRTRGAAVRASLNGAAGTVPALARRDRNQALKRAARAAENLGVLTGGALASGDFAPSATRTAFRPSVPPPRPRRGPRLAGPQILLYHRVAALDLDPLGLAVAPSRFAEQLDVLCEQRRVRPLATLVDAARAGEAECHDIAISFDDGYADVALTAAPLLAERGLPWTLFVATGHVEDQRAFWWDEVVRLLAGEDAPPELSLRIGRSVRAWRTSTADQRASARAAALAALQGEAPAAIAAALAELRSWTSVDTTAPARDRPMTIAELRDVAAIPGIAIGAHTRTHRGLAYAPEADQRQEIVRSRDDLTAWLGEPPASFSYPFGVLGADFDTTAQRITAEAGFRHAVSNVPGALGRATDLFAVPRRAVPDLARADFARWLAAR